MPTIAIFGASNDRTKFGNKAVRAFLDKGYQVFPINPKESLIEGIRCYKSVMDVPSKELDMVSFYLPPAIGLQAIEIVAKKEVKEVWLNPGAESDELMAKGEKLGLKMISACNIVGIGSSPTDYD